MINSAGDKEIEEYTKNLGIEYRFGCYSEKNPEGKKFHTQKCGKLSCSNTE